MQGGTGNGGFGRSQQGFQMPGSAAPQRGAGGFGQAMGGLRQGMGQGIGRGGMDPRLNQANPADYGLQQRPGGGFSQGGGFMQNQGRGGPQMSQVFQNSSPGMDERMAAFGSMGQAQNGQQLGSLNQIGGQPLPRTGGVSPPPTMTPPGFQRPMQGDPASVFGKGNPVPDYNNTWNPPPRGPRPPPLIDNPFMGPGGSWGSSGGGLLDGGQGQAQSAGTAWDGLSAMDNLTGSGALDFTFDPAKFGKDQQGMYFSAASLGQNRGMGPNMWLTDPNTGQVLSGNPNGGGLAGGMGNVFGQGLTPGQKYKLNYAGGQGPFRISGNFR